MQPSHPVSSREVILFGASGYSGLELLRLLATHPLAKVIGASSVSYAGERVSMRVPEWPTDLAFEPHDVVLPRAEGERIAILATPAKTSAEIAPLLYDRGVSVIDLSGAFRLDRKESYPEWYGFEHPRPDLLTKADYGLVELFPPRPQSTKARLIANPGCYATAAVLAAAPLILSGLIPENVPLVVDGKSGATGAGRTLDEKLLFSEVDESVRPYRVGRHQHTPEIERALSRLAGHAVAVSFTAHLVPMRRGLLTSVYVPAVRSVTQESLNDAFAAAYKGERFIRVLTHRPPETGVLSGNNFAEVGAVLDPRTRMISAFATIDNLGKGAAGQAIQNLNAVMGVELSTGLSATRPRSLEPSGEARGAG